MARALMSDPKMIMLDEPMAGVNPALTQSLLGHIQTLRDEGTTVLFVEHDMHVVRHISDWVAVMAEGRLVAEGPADTVMSNPAVIDAYLGAHHDTDLGDDALLSDEALEQIAEEVGRGGSRARGGAGMSSSSREQRHAPSDAVVEAKDVVAGYLPGVNILNGCSLVAYPGEMIGIIGPERRRQVHAAQGDVRPGQGPLRHRHARRPRHHQPAANKLVEMGVGFVPQTNNVFPTLTIEENLRMGLFHAPQEDQRAARRDVGPLPGPARPPQPARGRAVRR